MIRSHFLNPSVTISLAPIHLQIQFTYLFFHALAAGTVAIQHREEDHPDPVTLAVATLAIQNKKEDHPDPVTLTAATLAIWNRKEDHPDPVPLVTLP